MQVIIGIGFCIFVIVCKKVQKKYRISIKDRFKVINKMYDE
jgi:predicted small secreted protein